MKQVNRSWNYPASYQILLSFSLTELIDITLCVVFNGCRETQLSEIVVKTREKMTVLKNGC
jgi:hypothetical protein